MIESADHWWQNWPKTHGYVAEKMFFPSSASDIALAIQAAERDRRPLRAVGGGWSFSDASLPGTVTTRRPNIRGVEAISEAVPQAQRFSTDPAKPLVASITPAPVGDAPGSLVMFDATVNPPVINSQWSYKGGGEWTDQFGKPQGPSTRSDLLDFLAKGHLRPLRPPGTRCQKEADAPGTMVMFDLSANSSVASRDWFYNGGGVWTVGAAGDSPPLEGNLEFLSRAGRLSGPTMNLSPRAADPAESLHVLLSKSRFTPTRSEPAYLMNTRSLVSSLQQDLPNILTASALDETSRAKPVDQRRFYFHVEAGITIAELGQLLAHQSPRLSLRAISGSPGATLAGALATATHGAEFNWPLLIDSVKAVHLVGPGGLQWWIEGDVPIADPQKLRAVYPDIDPSRIIQGARQVGGVVPQDWLGAAIVSLGCLGVVYSVVLEVVPLFGVREVVVKKTWGNLFLGSEFAGAAIADVLKDPAKTKRVSARIVKLMQNGILSGTGIPQFDQQGSWVNQYADLAINPIPHADGTFDCWISNRERTAQLPLDAQPAASIVTGVASALEPRDIQQKLGKVFGLSDIHVEPPTWPEDAVSNKGRYEWMLGRITGAADVVDVALDVALEPMGQHPNGPDVAQALLTGILSGLLNTANCDQRSDLTGVSVGNLGFPASGIMGTALEIALAPVDAFGFVQAEILDKMTRSKPFYGYISIRLCSKTQTLLGMQQFGGTMGTSPPSEEETKAAVSPCSVMVEVVAFANDDARSFIKTLQQRTANLIRGGLDAMLHWGLENDEITAAHLGATRALQAPSNSRMSKLATFKAVRARLHAPVPSAFRVFDSAFTQRLGFSSSSAGLVFCDANGVEISQWVPTAWNTPPGTPLVERHRSYLEELYLLNRSRSSVQVDDVRIVSSADAPGAPVFTVLQPTPFAVPPNTLIPVTAIAVEYMGAPAGPLTGTVLVECALDQTATIDLSTSVLPNRHAELAVAPPSLDFGRAIAGTSADSNVTLTNTGTHAAAIDSIAVVQENPAGQFTAVFVRPFSIPPGQSNTVQVSFHPTIGGSAEATLAIDMRSTTDIATEELRARSTAALSGTSLAPRLFLVADPEAMRRRPITSLDFGTAAPGTELKASFWILNVGDAPLVVQSANVVSATNSFGVIDLSVFPATLQRGDELEVQCNFVTPAAGLAATGVLQVSSNDPRQVTDAELGVLNLTGRASGPHLTNPPEELRLGTEAPLSTSATLVFRSDGTDPVTIVKIGLEHRDDFSLGGVMRGDLAPGSDLTLTVTLTATQPGPYQNLLTVRHNGSPSGESRVALRGVVA